MPKSSSLYGLGERTPSRGFRLPRDGIPMAQWTRDSAAADPDLNSYGSWPVLLEVREGECTLASSTNGLSLFLYVCLFMTIYVSVYLTITVSLSVSMLPHVCLRPRPCMGLAARLCVLLVCYPACNTGPFFLPAFTQASFPLSWLQNVLQPRGCFAVFCPPPFRTLNHGLACPDGTAHGTLLFNSNGMDVVLTEDAVSWRVIGGQLDFYFLTGPTPMAVMEQVTSIIGRPFMPPYWSLGLMNSK